MSVPNYFSHAGLLTVCCQVFDGGPVGLGTMTVVHAAECAEGSETVLPGVYAGGFDSLVYMTRQVRRFEA